MIENLTILNYKSAREVQLTCKKLNIIIGQPNSGKSNILEALGLFSLFNNECKINELVRFQSMHNLFYDNAIENQILIRTDTHRMKIQFRENFEVDIETRIGTTIKSYDLYYDQTGKLLNSNPHYVSPICMYKFKPENVFLNKSNVNLRPPYGDNLVLMLMKSPELRKEAARVFLPYGYRFVINPLDSSIQLQKESDGVVFGLPYTLSSNMLQRFVFHMAAIETNNNATIIFEEPEAYESTSVIEEITQKIADDNTNQFFISTYNPNFLVAALQKMKMDDVKIYYAFYDNYQTQVKALIEEDFDIISKKSIDMISKLEKRLADRI
jgi:AAA15 family ATPase/GTPase